MADTYVIEISLTGKNQFGSTADSVTNNLNRIRRSTDDTDSSLGRMERSVRRVQQAMELGIAGAMLGKVNQFAQEFYELGQQVEVTEQTFAALVGTTEEQDALMRMLRESTGGIISDMTLMQGASRLMSMGLAENSRETARLTELAVKLGAAMGNDAQASIENFSLLLANESVLRLDSFGISSARVRTRIDELLASGEALNRSDAFRLAVLEEGGASLERLGDAATAAETPLARLQTRLENIAQQAAQNFAVGVNAIIGLMDAVTEHQTDVRAEVERAEAVLRAQVGTNYTQADIERVMEQLRVEDEITAGMIARAEARAEERAEAERLGSVLDRQNEARREAARAQTALNQLNDRAFDTQVRMVMTFEDLAAIQMQRRGSVGGVTLFTPEEAQRAAELENRVRMIQDSLLAAQGAGAIVPEDALQRAQNMVTAAEQMRENIEAGAEAFRNMGLADALAGGERNLLLSDINAAILQEIADQGLLDEEATQAAADTFMLAAGDLTQASITMRDSVIPRLAEITATLGAATGARRAGQVEDYIRSAALAGLDPNSQEYQIGLQLATGTIGNFDFQGTFENITGLFGDAFAPLQELTGEMFNFQTQTEEAEQKTSDLGVKLATIPGPIQAIEDTDTLATKLQELADTEFTVNVRIVVEGDTSLIGGGGFAVGGTSGGSATVTRDTADLRGRGTTSGGTAPARTRD